MNDDRPGRGRFALFATAVIALALWLYLLGTLAAALGVPRIA